MVQPKICLLVDDDPDDQEVFLTALNDVSASVLCLVAADGDRALELLYNEDTIPDYIFLDLNMPEMTGWEFLDEYQRYLQRCQHPPKLYIVSSSTAESDEARAMKTAGVSGYIPKPLHTEGVRSMLQIASLEPGR